MESGRRTGRGKSKKELMARFDLPLAPGPALLR